MSDGQLLGEGARRLGWLDAVRAAACLMVVLLHAASPATAQKWTGAEPALAWHVANVIHAMTRIAVPLFFMISGYLYLSREDFPLGRRLARVLVPLVFYTVIAAAYRDATGPDQFSKVLFGAFTAPAFYHLWFFYTLAILVVFFALIRPRAIDPLAGIAISLAILFLFGSSAEYIANVTFGFQSAFAEVRGPMEAMVFCFLGYFCGRLDLDRSRFVRPPVTIALFVGGWAVAALGTLYISLAAGAPKTAYYSQGSPFVAISAIGLFLALRQAAPTSRLLGLVATYSLGIYGFHAFVMASIPPAWTGWAGQVGAIGVRFALALAGALVLSVLVGLVDRKRWLV
ncbi:MAG TPA: acyltransferase family protein [Bauldia sp.]|nr:acyltransferase family protein [Bauldia sp.]